MYIVPAAPHRVPLGIPRVLDPLEKSFVLSVSSFYSQNLASLQMYPAAAILPLHPTHMDTSHKPTLCQMSQSILQTSPQQIDRSHETSQPSHSTQKPAKCYHNVRSATNNQNVKQTKSHNIKEKSQCNSSDQRIFKG